MAPVVAHGSQLKKNLAAVLYAKQDVRMEEREVPTPGDNDVLVEMKNVGICGSDLHYFMDGHHGRFVLTHPIVMGHESSGTVMAVGKKVKHLEQGDRVAMEPAVPCRYCKWCKIGRYNLCIDVTACSIPPHDGNLCRYYCHPADFTYKLPDNVSMEEGSLLEPLSIAVHAMRRINMAAGDRVLICGAGPIGLICLLAAKAYGASNIIITDVIPFRLEMAKKLGADHVIDVKGRKEDDVIREIEGVTGILPNQSLECVGSEPTIHLAMMATEMGGNVALVGMGAPTATVPLLEVCSMREVNIIGIFRTSSKCYETALALVASGKIDAKPLVTHRFKLEETPEALQTALHAKETALKVMMDCS